MLAQLAFPQHLAFLPLQQFLAFPALLTLLVVLLPRLEPVLLAPLAVLVSLTLQ